MRVLVIGGGGREHALCWALARSPRLTTLYCAPGNGGAVAVAEQVALDMLDFAACAEWAERNAIDLTVVGPEEPLSGGIVDVFVARGLRIFGPTAAAAQVEGSKSWAKRVMRGAGVPTARAELFDDYDAARAYLEGYTREGGAFPVVIKADGLAAGKGVVIAADMAAAGAALDALLRERQLGDAGAQVLIEEYLTGRELSLFALVDGEYVAPLAPACDYKRAFDGDEGPNTGGMGAYSPPAFATRALLDEIETRILRPMARAMVAEGAPFRGLLYAGLMVTAEGPYVIEFNARFGDPETQVVLPRLESDLLDLLVATADGRLSEAAPLRWSAEVACGVALVAGGYPGVYARGNVITGLETLGDDVLVFHAGTRRDALGRLVTAGGRVLTLVGRGATLAEARGRVYARIEKVRFEGARWRADIALREV